MSGKTVSGIMLVLLVTSMLMLVFDIQPVWASETITINADGRITPPSAPIFTADNVTYMLTGNIIADGTNGIVIERDNIVLNGAGYALTESGTGTIYSGISLASNNVTVNNMTITNFYDGIVLEESSNITLSGNNVTANSNAGIALYSSGGNILSGNNVTNSQWGIALSSNTFFFGGSSNNTLSGNNVANNGYGIYLDSSSNNNNVLSGNNVAANSYDGIDILAYSYGNALSGNNVTANNYDGILVYGSSGDTLSGNNVANNMDGIDISFSSNNTLSGNNVTANSNAGIALDSSSGNPYPTNYNIISGNNVTNNEDGISLYSSSNNNVFHNNFVNNTIQVYSNDSTNIWDNGYPSGGNYWSDYNGTDSYSGPYQNVTGSDGIGDTPYIIDANNTDRYPLMTQYVAVHDVAVPNVTSYKTVVGQGFNTSINITVVNEGDYSETFTVTTYLILPPPHTLAVVIATTPVSLDAGNSTAINLAWNTTDYDIGNYTISVTAGPVPGETNTADNTFSVVVKVTIPGDLNGDFKVSLTDLVLLANAYGSKPGDTKWNPNADINGDGKVSLSDLVILANHYGQHYP